MAGEEERRRWKRRLIVLAMVAVAFPFVLRVVIMGKLAYDAGSGDLWSIWACDADSAREGRTNIERAGCVVPMPSVGMRHAIYSPPARAAEQPVDSFLMGAQAESPDAPGYDPAAAADEGPPRAVTLDPFALQRFAVSVRQFRWCITYGPCDAEDVGQGEAFTFSPMSIYDAMMVIREGDDRPITGITWEGAKTYCEWVGGRLPTEAEWEYAARGGPLQRRYPWGEEEPTCDHAYVANDGARACDVDGPMSAALDPPEGADRLGLLVNQSGNVMEWTADWYAPNAYATGAAHQPKGPESGTERVARGGSWQTTQPASLRSAARHHFAPDAQLPGVGVRCAVDAIDEDPIAMIDEFERPALEGWRMSGGGGAPPFTMSQGMVTAHDVAEARSMWRLTPAIKDTQLSARLFPQLDALGKVALLYGVQSDTSLYRAELYPGVGVARLIRVLDGVEGVIAEATDLAIPAEAWMTMNISWRDGAHVLSLGQAELVSGRDASWSEGGVGLLVDGRGDVSFDAIFTSPSEHAVFANSYAVPTTRDPKFYEGRAP
ncbi:MAG: formylglycine-generating enzyme family protein [Myxococcota bacterium]